MIVPTMQEDDAGVEKLDLSKRDLDDTDLCTTTGLFPSKLRELNLSRNSLTCLPTSVLLSLHHLIRLDLSRNSLKGLPPEIRLLTNLEELMVVSNNLRLRLLPLQELASLAKLRLLDLRYNTKLKQGAMEQIRSTLRQPHLNLPSTDNTTMSTTEAAIMKKLCACDRDATLLQSQLEPLSTPQLRKRLERTFAVRIDDNDDRAYDRDFVMAQLLACYQDCGGRRIRAERGIPVRPERLEALLHELEAIPWPHTTRERPKIKAEYYMILQKPGSGQPHSAKTLRETAKVQKYHRLFDLAVDTIKEVDGDFAKKFTALAVTKNFTGSPHIDTLNIGPFYGIALGDYEMGGGKLAVECCPLTVAEIDTRGCFAKVDGRFPHWVTPYKTGTRYSLIYYVTSGEVEPQTTAIFDPRGRRTIGDDDENGDEPWIPPPVYIP